MQIVIDRIPEVDLSHLPESRRRVNLEETLTIPEPTRRYVCQHCGARISRYNPGTTCWPCEDRILREQLRNPDRVNEADDLETVVGVITRNFGTVSECESALGTSCLVDRLRTGKGLTTYMADRINVAIANSSRARLRWMEREGR